jgi:hypothetical protein
VTIGRRFRHKISTNIPTGAGAIFHHHILAEGFGEFWRKQARYDVRGSTRREGHNEAYWPIQILRNCGQGSQA